MDPFAIQTGEKDFQRKIGPAAIAPSMSFFVWGSGQLYNGESRKAAIFFTGQFVAFLYLWDYYNQYLVYQVMVSHLGDFLYSFLIFLFSFGVLFVWIYNLFDAHRMASFLDFISHKSPTAEDLEEIQGWDFEVDHRNRDKVIPWGSAFVYVVSVLVLIKYVFSPSQSEIELLVRRVQERPGGVTQRLELAGYYARNGKVRHAIVEVEEFLVTYGTTLKFEERQQLGNFLQNHRSQLKETAFVTEKVLEPEDATDWVGLNEKLPFKAFENRAIGFLARQKDHPVLVSLLVNEYMQRSSWQKARNLLSSAMRSRPHDPLLIQSLNRVEEELRKGREKTQKLGLQKRAFTEAVTYYQQEKFSESKNALDRYFHLEGDSKEAYLLANANLIKTGDFKGATELLRKALGKYSEDAMLRYFLGKAYYGKKEYKNAVEHFHQAAKLKSDDPEIFKNLAIAYKKLGNYAQAIVWYRRALQLKKDNPALLFLLGYAQFKNRDQAHALETYRKLTRLYPQYPELDYYRALVEEQNGLLIGARDSLRNVKKTSPFFEQSRQKIDYLTLKISKIKSKKDGKKAGETIEQVPHWLESSANQNVNSRQNVAQTIGGVSEAVTRIDKIAALLKNAEILVVQEKWSEARQGFSEILALDGNHFYSLKQIGKILLEREGNYEKASEYFSRALTLKPNDVWLNVAMGVSSKAMDNVDDAIKYFEHAIEMDSANLNANFNLALLYEDQNRLEEAKEYYARVLSNHPGHQLSYNYLGDLHYNEGDFGRAARMYREFLRLAPENIGITFKLALCQERAADYSGSLQTLNQLRDRVRGEAVMEEEILAVIRRVEANL
jgi:tetratricopeptide (TPR) repeat protein